MLGKWLWNTPDFLVYGLFGLWGPPRRGKTFPSPQYGDSERDKGYVIEKDRVGGNEVLICG